MYRVKPGHFKNSKNENVSLKICGIKTMSPIFSAELLVAKNLMIKIRKLKILV